VSVSIGARLPVSWLFERYKALTEEPMLAGRLPLRLLLLRDKYLILGSWKIELGIAPENKLPDRSMLTKEGSVPLAPIVEGITPERTLFDRLRLTKLVRFEMEGGRVPSRRLESRMTAVTLPETEQVIPYQRVQGSAERFQV